MGCQTYSLQKCRLSKSLGSRFWPQFGTFTSGSMTRTELKLISTSLKCSTCSLRSLWYSLSCPFSVQMCSSFPSLPKADSRDSCVRSKPGWPSLGPFRARTCSFFMQWAPNRSSSPQHCLVFSFTYSASGFKWQYENLQIWGFVGIRAVVESYSKLSDNFQYAIIWLPFFQ